MRSPEPHTTWRKSSRSTAQGNQCVELAPVRGGVAVRDSTNPDGPALAFSAARWRAFTSRVKTG